MTYGPMPQNLTLNDVDQRIALFLQSQSAINAYAPKSIPWQAVVVPLVAVFPQSPDDRDEVNILDSAAGKVTRWIWVKSLNKWVEIPSTAGTAAVGTTGTLGWSSTSAAPTGGLIADGSAVTSTYPALRALLIADGSPHGSSGGDPLLPNCIDQFFVGAGSTYALGGTGGEATHTLTTAEMPNHRHQLGSGSGSYDAAQDGAFTTGAAFNNDGASRYAGGGGAHNNLPPYIALTPFIWT